MNIKASFIKCYKFNYHMITLAMATTALYRNVYLLAMFSS